MFTPVPLVAEITVSTTFMVCAILAIAAQSVLLLVALFERGLRYKIETGDIDPTDEQHFLYMVEALTDAKLNRHTKLQVHANGENFYTAELEAISRARSSVHIEAYIFQKGDVATRFIHALAERARAGVKVRLVLDGLGSAATKKDDFRELIAAGGQVAFYHPFTFANLPKYNNRTHREIIIIDGEAAFVGGAGIADHWMKSTEKTRRWRDTMVFIEGEAVKQLQATFTENWLESTGEVLTGKEVFPFCEDVGDSPSFVINSTPSAGGSTRARVLFQLLLASARRSIHITTPYFLPDRSVINQLIKAHERGVEVVILVPGKHNDHLLTRSSSRMAYGRLLKHGIKIFEYTPSMLHAKILLIDGIWAVVGSTNFDNRSFGINDEVNVAIYDETFADRLEQDFRQDLAESHAVSYGEWRRRPILERVPELMGWVLERQQ